MRFYLRHCLAVLNSAEVFYFLLMFKQVKKRMVAGGVAWNAPKGVRCGDPRWTNFVLTAGSIKMSWVVGRLRIRVQADQLPALVTKTIENKCISTVTGSPMS